MDGAGSTIEDPAEAAAALVEARKLLNSMPPSARVPTGLAVTPATGSTAARRQPAMLALAALLLVVAIAYFALR